MKEYRFPQSPSYPEVPLNPFRLCIASSTVDGKTTNILNMRLRIARRLSKLVFFDTRNSPDDFGHLFKGDNMPNRDFRRAEC